MAENNPRMQRPTWFSIAWFIACLFFFSCLFDVKNIWHGNALARGEALRSHAFGTMISVVMFAVFFGIRDKRRDKAN